MVSEEKMCRTNTPSITQFLLTATRDKEERLRSTDPIGSPVRRTRYFDVPFLLTMVTERRLPRLLPLSLSRPKWIMLRDDDSQHETPDEWNS